MTGSTFWKTTEHDLDWLVQGFIHRGDVETIRDCEKIMAVVTDGVGKARRSVVFFWLVLGIFFVWLDSKTVGSQLSDVIDIGIDGIGFVVDRFQLFIQTTVQVLTGLIILELSWKIG